MVLQRRGIDQGLVACARAGGSHKPQRLADAEQAALRALFGRRIIEFREADSAHQSGVGFERQLSVSSGKRGAGLMNRDAAEQAFVERELVVRILARRCCRTRTASRVTSTPIPSPGSTRTFRFMDIDRGESRTDCATSATAARADYLWTTRSDLLVPQALLAVGQGGEPVIDRVELLCAEIETQLLATVLQSVATAVFTQHQLAFGNSDRLRIDDLVRGSFLQEAILMDARFVREGVLADDGLVGLRSEADDELESSWLAG